MNHENCPNWRLMKVIGLQIAACEGEHPDGSSVASKGLGRGVPRSSAPVQLHVRPFTFVVATDTTSGEPFISFLAQKFLFEKLSSERV